MLLPVPLVLLPPATGAVPLEAGLGIEPVEYGAGAAAADEEVIMLVAAVEEGTMAAEVGMVTPAWAQRPWAAVTASVERG